MAQRIIRQISPGIVSDSGIGSGRWVIEGTRVFVDLIIANLESGRSKDELCSEYDLTPQQVRAVEQYMVQRRMPAHVDVEVRSDGGNLE